MEVMSLAKALGASALLFAAIHVPYWYLSGDKTGWALLYALVPIFVLGVVFAAVFKFSGSLWSAILVHIANNVLSSF